MQSANLKWVWIRGLTRGTAHWGDAEAIWLQKHPQDQIIHVEIPGCGAKFSETSALSIAENVERMRVDLETQKSHRQITGPLNVLSVSLGGMIAAEWMTRYPQDFSSAVVINSSSAGLSMPWERCLPEAWATLATSARIEDPAKREEKILALLTNTTPKIKEYIQQFAQEAQTHPIAKLNAVFQLLAASQFHWPQVKPKIPVLFLAAQKDRMVSYRCSQKLADYWEAPLVVHPTAGHELTLDDTEWVIEQIDSFLGR